MPVVREKVVQQAEKYVSRGKIEAGIREYRKLLADQPNDISTLNRVGDLYTRIGRNAEAIQLFEQIAERYSEDGFFVKAIAIFKKIIKIDPTRLGIYERLAELYHRQGLVNEARTQYQVLADYYQKHDDPDGAVGIYRRMVELEPDNPGHRARLAEVHRLAGRTAEAMAEYRVIAETMVDHGEAEQAAQVYERALEVSSDDLGFVTDGVLKLKAAGETGAAARFLAAAVAKNPEARRVARLAGLESRSTAPRRRSRTPPPDLDEPAAPAAAEAAGPPAASGASASAPEAPAEPALEDDMTFELDLDEEEPTSLVTPPADMLADGGRPGAAWRARSEAGAAEPAQEPAAPAAGPSPPPPSRDELEDSFVFDLDEDLLADEPAAEAPPPSPSPTSPPPASELDHDLLERTADAVAPTRQLVPDDLLTEAEVLAKYGIVDKAVERLRELLEHYPDHLEGLALLAELELEGGRADELAEIVARLVRAAEVAGRPEVWEPLRERLEGAGWSFASGRIEPPSTAPPATAPSPRSAPVPPPPSAEEEERLVLPDLGDEPETAAAAEPPETASDLEVLESALTGLAAAEPEAAGDAALDPLRALGDSLRDELGVDAPAPAAPPPSATASPPPAASSPPSAASSPPSAASSSRSAASSSRSAASSSRSAAGAGTPPSALDDSTSWLDELTAAARPEGEELAGEAAAGFFDLGAELEQELTGEGLADDLFGADQSIEEIVEGFRKGVAETLSAEDFDTHFNLGIAFREMGLLDEAIGEFQLAAKDPAHLVPAASMLGLCFLQKGMPELAVKWYRRGLEAASSAEDDRLGLLYDLGNAYLAAGEPAEARSAFVEIYGVDSTYRDVVAKLAELDG